MLYRVLTLRFFFSWNSCSRNKHLKLLFFFYSIQGEVVCRTCYIKKYSCSAFTLSGADMLKLLDTTTIKSGSEADKDACPRCQGRVFHAEKVEVKDKAYHKKCACCFNCSKPLSSRDLCEGKDGNIFCSSCYSRKFGAPGYRGKFVYNKTKAQKMKEMVMLTIKIWVIWISRTFWVSVYLSIVISRTFLLINKNAGNSNYLNFES